MPSPTLEKLRTHYPEFDEISDKDLTVRVGNKYPNLLKKDEEFLKEYTDYSTVSTGEELQHAYKSFTTAVTDSALGVPDSIAIATTALNRATDWDDVVDPDETLSGTFAKMIREEVVPAVTPDFSESETRQMEGDFWSTKLPSALGSGLGFIAGGLGIKQLLAGGLKKGADKLTKHYAEEATKAALKSGATKEVASKIGQKIGTQVAAKWSAKVAKRQGIVAVSALGAAVSGPAGYKDAIANGATENEAFASFLLNAGVGTSEAITVVSWLDRLGGKLAGGWKRALVNAGKEGLEEAAQELFQGAAGDYIARDIVQYDKDREILANLKEDAAVGGTSGVLLSLLASAVGAKLNRADLRETSPRTASKLDEAEQKRAQAAYNEMAYVPFDQPETETKPKTEVEAKPKVATPKPAKVEDKPDTLEPVVIPLPDEVDDVPDIGVPTPEVDAKIAEAESEVGATESAGEPAGVANEPATPADTAAKVDSITVDDLDIIADQLVAEELGLDAVYPVDPNRAQIIAGLNEKQKEYLESSIKEVRDTVSQYKDKPQVWNEIVRKTRERLGLDVVEAPSAQAETIKKDVVTHEKAEVRASLIQKLTALAQPTSKIRSAGRFLWREFQGGAGNRGAVYTNKPKDIRTGRGKNQTTVNGGEYLTGFKAEVEAFAKENNVSGEELLAELKQEVLDAALATKPTKKGVTLQDNRAKASREFFNLPEGETDILDDQLSLVGPVLVPVGKDGKVLTADSKETAPAEYDGIDRFGHAANELASRHSKEASKILKREEAGKVRGSSATTVDAAVAAINEQNGTSLTIDDYWNLMADAIERRLAAVEAKQKGTDQVSDVSVGITKQSEGDTAVKVSDLKEGDSFTQDGKSYTIELLTPTLPPEGADLGQSYVALVLEGTLSNGGQRYIDITLPADETVYLGDYSTSNVDSAETQREEIENEVVNEPTDVDVPFATVPDGFHNGVAIPAPSNDAEKNVLGRIAKLLPRIQKKLGGAKVRNILINRRETLPAFSGARGGDFGSIYINPEVILAMEANGVANLEDILIEEIIHNYNGLAIYHRWNDTGRKGSFTEFYEELMTGVFSEMSVNEIAQTVFYYGEQIKGDRVAIAEEYIRIALQRKLTGSINEDLFGRKVDQGGFLSKIMEILSRWWNGLSRGMMIKSPRIRQLKRRVRRMMKDDRVVFPIIDGAKLTFTPASQGEFEFEGEQILNPEVKLNHREYEETYKEENRFDDNTGDFMAALFRCSQVELKKEGIKRLKRETIPASDAVFMEEQKNLDVPLPEEFYSSAYVNVHEALGKRNDLNDLQKDQAFFYIYSRITNAARGFIIKKKRFDQSSMEALAGFSPAISRKVVDYQRFASGLTKRQVKSGDGLVTLDVPVELEGTDATTMHEMVSNPMDTTPDLEMINDELLRYINDATSALTGSEKDLLLFAFENNFAYGWQSAFAKSRKVSRSAVNQLFRSFQEKMALQLAVKKDLAVQIGADVPPKLKARIRKVQDAYDVLDKNRKTEREAEDEAAVKERVKELTAEEAKEPVTPVNTPRSVEVTPGGETISVASDITHPNVRRLLNLPPLKRDEEGRIENVPRTEPLLKDKGPRKITAASLPTEVLAEVKERAEQIRAREAAGYRADEATTADSSIERNDSRSDEIKERMEAAADNTVDASEERKEKFNEILEILNHLKRQYRYLDPSKHAELIEVLRQFEDTQQASQAMAHSALIGITSGLTADQHKFLTDILVYRDLQQSIKNGLYQNNKGLPFGFQSASEVDFILQEAEADLAKPENQKVRDALARRKDVLEGLTRDLQRRKLLPEDITDAENYFHRITLEYRSAAKKDDFTGQTDVRTKKKGFQKKRKGSEKDYTTDFVESEFEVLSQGYAQARTHEILERLDKMLNQKSVMKDLAKQSNEAALMKVVPFGDIDAFFAPFHKNIAIGISQIQKLISKGGIIVPARFDAAAEALDSGTKHPDTFLLLKHLMDVNSSGAGYAGMIFKAIRAKEKAIQTALGNDYKTWRDVVSDNDALTIWQPEEGNFLYKGTVASDAALIKWYEEASKGDTTTISEKDLRKQMVLGGRKSEWVVPNEVAKQLNQLAPETSRSPMAMLGQAIGSTQAQWKFWKLFNPFGFIKYELNNLTGDADVAFAYDPKIFTYAKQAYNDLYGFHVNKEPLSKDMEDLMKKGVLGSGYMLQDLAEMKPELAVEAMFEDFTDGLKKKSGWFKEFSNNYTKKVTTFNQVREDTLRLAAYRYFQDKLETGADVYGASKPSELALIPDKKDKAAKMARELLGDYGALSVSGKWLRQHMFPFWSWMEINAPRYVRMMKNAKLEDKTGSAGRMAGVAGKKAALKTAKFALLASTLPFFVNMWNRFFIEAGFADEEDKRVMDARNQQHLLLYSTSEGRVISLKMQGALTDALEWFGAGSFYATATDVALTDATAMDAAEQYLTEGEYWRGAVNRLGTSLTPVIKLPAELFTKKQFFPDVTKPAPMRDKWAYFLQNAEMNWPMMGVNALYQLGRDMPSTGVTGAGSPARSLWNFVGYTTDTGESAYNYIRSKAFDFYEEKEGEQAGFNTTSRQDALYYYKKAKKYGDEGSAETWKQRYTDLGGTKSGMKRSVTASHPLGKIRKHKKEFLRGLTNTEKEILQRAEKWYKETMD